jgi:hypothetical protein
MNTSAIDSASSPNSTAGGHWVQRLVRMIFRSEGHSSLRRMAGIVGLRDRLGRACRYSPKGSLQVQCTDHRRMERPDRSRRGILGEPGVSRRSFIFANDQGHVSPPKETNL